jgi:hypothetical protein
MDNEIKVICIEVESLKNIIHEIVSEELEKFKEKLRHPVVIEKPLGDKLRTKDIAEFLGCCTKTINTYRQKGFLPSPKMGLNGKPYWDKEDIIKALRNHDLAYKYKV